MKVLWLLLTWSVTAIQTISDAMDRTLRMTRGMNTVTSELLTTAPGLVCEYVYEPEHRTSYGLSDEEATAEADVLEQLAHEIAQRGGSALAGAKAMFGA